MNIGPADYAYLSDYSYGGLGSLSNETEITLGGGKYTILQTSENPTNGYFGMVVKAPDDSLIVINRGTEPAINDFSTDYGMLAYQVNAQWPDAKALTQWALDNSNGFPVEAAGHSLGGALAQMQAATFGLTGTTFDAYGAGDLVGTIHPDANITNYVRATDIVSAASPHVGNVVVVATNQDVFAATFHDNPFFFVGLNIGNAPSAHKVAQFHENGGIINQETIKNYNDNKQIFDSYRENIQSVAQAASGPLKDISDGATALVQQYLNNPPPRDPTFQSVDAMDMWAALVWVGKKAYDAGKDAVTEMASQFVSWLLSPASGFLLTPIALVQQLYGLATLAASPLILDLDGDGVVETTALANGTYFDHDGNGFAERSGWVGKDDGLLVWDRNGNGQIDTGAELFGNHTGDAANGFAALGTLDSNGDGVIDATDADFSQLRVWRDLDGDGSVDNGEMLTLADAGVASLNLAFTERSGADANGNQHRQQGSFTGTDGAEHAMHDVWFKADTADTVDQDQVAISEEIAAMPQVYGFGNVHSLQQAMARDTSGHLQGLVAQFKGLTDPNQFSAKFEELLLAWAGVEGIAPDSRGPNVDARHLAVLEQFMGQDFYQNAQYGSNPGRDAGQLVEQAYSTLTASLQGQLLAQTHFADLLALIQPGLGADGTLVFDTTALAAELQRRYGADVNANATALVMVGNTLDSLGDLWEGAKTDLLARVGTGPMASLLQQGIGLAATQYGDDGVNVLTARSDLNSFLFGGGGKDTLNGGTKDDYLDGGDGDDKLYGGAGDDRLIGGTGNDSLYGNAGSNSFFFSLGDGQDYISNSVNGASEQASTFNKLEFGAGIRPEDIVVRRSVLSGAISNDLILSIQGTQDKITVSGYYTNEGVSRYRLNEIHFDDGTVWTSDRLRDMALTPTDGNDYLAGYNSDDTLYGNAGNDRITGLDGNDYLDGGDGDDTLFGNAGDDRLIGGKGNDSLRGGEGSNTFVFNLGDGQDYIDNYIYSADPDPAFNKLEFGAGIRPEDIVVRRSVLSGAISNDLILSIQGTQDKITVSGYYTNEGVSRYRLNEIHFDDGTVWTPDRLRDMALTPTDGNDYLAGYNSDDTLHGNAGNDRITGLGGNDYLDGGDGDDTLFGDAGDDRLIGGQGKDYLYGGEGSNTFVFNQGDGQDYISNYIYSADPNPAFNKLEFGQGIAASDVTITRPAYSSDLVLALKGTTDKVTVSGYFSDESRYRMNEIHFTDGTTWTKADLDGLAATSTAETSTMQLVQQLVLTMARMNSGGDASLAPSSSPSTQNHYLSLVA